MVFITDRALASLVLFAIVLLFEQCYGHTSGHSHKHRSRGRSRTPTHSAQPLVAEHPSGNGSPASAGAVVGPECDYVVHKQTGCEDEHGSQCNSSTGKCECKASHPVRLLDFCLPVSRLNGPCYTSGQCSNVLNASCYIFGKEYDLETASGGHNLGRQVKNWPLGVCKCRLGFAFNATAGICEKRLVGSWCSNDKHCLLRSLNSICDKKRGECECSWGTAYEEHLDACVPSPIKPPTATKASVPAAVGAIGVAKSGDVGIVMTSPSPAVNSYRPLYLARCDSDADCENASTLDRQPTTSRLYQKQINSSVAPAAAVGSTHSTKKSNTLTISAGIKNVKSVKSAHSHRLQCVRGRCICGPTLVWEGGACREDWNAESDEQGVNGSTHHGRNRGDDLQEDEMDDDSSISWQTVIGMAIMCSLMAGFTFRACYYRKSEEDELAEDLRTAEALFAHKNAMGPQHPFNAITAAFLSKPPPVPPGAGGCGGSHKPPYGYHGPSGCYHHEPFGYNYGRCAASGPSGSGAVGHGGPAMPPPLNEQDEDDYLRQEAADKEAAEGAFNSNDSEGRSPQLANTSDAIEVISDESAAGVAESSCVAEMGGCGTNGCCGCECMLMPNHGGPGPLLSECCAGPIGTNSCGSAACPTVSATLTREQELAQELAELEAKERKKSLEAAADDDDSEETAIDDNEDDEKAAILRGSKVGGSVGLAVASGSSGLGSVASSSGAGALGRTICSTAAGLVLSQLTGANNNRCDHKITRRTRSCSSSSASLLNWSSSSNDSATGTGNGLEPTNGVTASQPTTAETVHLLVFSDPQSNSPA